MKNYKAIKEGSRYTIAEWDCSYDAHIVNDGIYGYYWWSTEDAALTAANVYNEYEGGEWLWQHGYGNDTISEDYEDEDMVDLYRLFNAVIDE